METKELKIQVSEGYEIDKEKSTKDTIVLNRIKKVDVDADFEKAYKEAATYGDYYNVFGFEMSDHYVELCVPSEEVAKAVNALCKLMFLKDAFNDRWEPDWNDDMQAKWVINRTFGELNVVYTTQEKTKLFVFPTKSDCKKFLEDYRELLETAKPLL